VRQSTERKVENKQMKREQEVLIKRIDDLCKERNLTLYKLSYLSTVPMTTLTHIMDGTTGNPGIFTIIKICEGLEISIVEFFATEEFAELLKECN